MALPRIQPRILAAFAAIYLLWGSTYLAIAMALPAIPPFLLMGTRSLTGGLILLARTKDEIASAPPRSWLVPGACGLLFFVGCHGVLAYAQEHVPSGMAAIILATIPFWIAIIGFLWPAAKERPRWWTLALLLPGLAGVAFIAWQQRETDRAGAHPLDIAILLGASVSWALGSVLSERQASQGNSPIARSGMALVVGGTGLLGMGGLAGEFHRLNVVTLSAAPVFAWLYLTLAGTVVAFSAYVWLLERVSSTLVGTYTFVNPIIAVILGWAVLGEHLSAPMLAGGALVVGSIVGLFAFDHPPRKNDVDHGASDL